MIAFARMIKTQGHKIILWTSRDGEELTAAVEWCKRQGLEFDAVNEPLPEQIARWHNNTRKIYADFYIDDRAVTLDQAERMVEQVADIMRSHNL